MQDIHPNCLICNQECCRAGQNFHFDTTEEGKNDAQRIIELNPGNVRIGVNKDRTQIIVILQNDCLALTDEGLCSVHHDSNSFPRACQNHDPEDHPLCALH
jgi:Fe-S-cluster containining protein